MCPGSCLSRLMKKIRGGLGLELAVLGSWFKAFMKLKGEALYEDNSRKRLPLMQRKLPLMRIQGEDGKNKAKAVYSL